MKSYAVFLHAKPKSLCYNLFRNRKSGIANNNSGIVIIFMKENIFLCASEDFLLVDHDTGIVTEPPQRESKNIEHVLENNGIYHE